jgi:hypothetical protein
LNLSFTTIGTIMNERIKQLAEQANLQDGWFCGQGNIEKFAQLIVKECSKVIVNGGYRNPALGEKHPLTPPEIATMIKEHFGVKE